MPPGPGRDEQTIDEDQVFAFHRAGRILDRDQFQMTDGRRAFVRHQDAQSGPQRIVIPEALDLGRTAEFLQRDFAIGFAIRREIVIKTQQHLLLRILKFKHLHAILLRVETASRIRAACRFYG